MECKIMKANMFLSDCWSCKVNTTTNFNGVTSKHMHAIDDHTAVTFCSDEGDLCEKATRDKSECVRYWPLHNSCTTLMFGLSFWTKRRSYQRALLQVALLQQKHADVRTSPPAGECSPMAAANKENTNRRRDQHATALINSTWCSCSMFVGMLKLTHVGVIKHKPCN